MKSYELLPTEENLFQTFMNDTISRNIDILRFITILDSVSDSCSIALDGNWGSGKTFFVKQTKMILDAHNAFLRGSDVAKKEQLQAQLKKTNRNADVELQPQVCVYYDAWENDNDDDPLLSLIYSILSSADTDFSFGENEGCLPVAASILELFTGREWKGLIEAIKQKTPFDQIKETKSIQQKIAEFLDSLLPERGNRLVVFVDELDRCKPSFAVRLLERIKHYFSNDRITFVFSINANELQHTIKRYYGDEFDACRYLDRFFDMRVSLPQADLSRYYQTLSFNNTRYVVDIVSDAVIRANHFELREIAKYLRLMKLAAYNVTHDSGRRFIFSDGEGLQFCLLCILPIMIGLKVVDSQRYEDFIHGKDSSPLFDMVNYLRDGFFDRLLSNDESFKDNNDGKKIVSVQDKLQSVYDALFCSSYTDNRYQHTFIGKYSFDKETTDILLRAASLLSDFTTLD